MGSEEELHRRFGRLSSIGVKGEEAALSPLDEQPVWLGVAAIRVLLSGSLMGC